MDAQQEKTQSLSLLLFVILGTECEVSETK